MKKHIFVALLLAPMLAQAKPSSNVAWTSEQLNSVKAGNASKGQVLAQACTACHGDKGISPSATTPSLAGQLPTYLFKQLQDYRDGNRVDPVMTGIAKSLSPQDTIDLAAWFASQQPAYQSAGKIAYLAAETLVKSGNSERVLPPCEVCHGRDGKGQAVDVPALSGQNAGYLTGTLNAFKTGRRGNDIYSRMRLIAKQLSDKEIEELGFYYQNIKN